MANVFDSLGKSLTVKNGKVQLHIYPQLRWEKAGRNKDCVAFLELPQTDICLFHWLTYGHIVALCYKEDWKIGLAY